MAILISKIVLTGGPCAGKTTALSRVEQNLTEQGYKVFVVSESATELIKGGIRPFGDDAIDMIEFQDLILKYQLSKEKIYEQAIEKLSEDKKCVIIYDRGIIDNKAYIGQTNFDMVLKRQGLSELGLMDNYDMIIHLVTSADGKEQFYTLENNQARSESASEAVTLDRKTMAAWAGHSNLKIIDNKTDFDEKINLVIDEINNLLGNPITIRKERKYLVNLESSDLSYLTENNSMEINLKQTYLESENGYERRLRKRTFNNQSTYYLTVQKKVKNLTKIVTDKKVTEKEYLRLLDIYKVKGEIEKTRYSFTLNKQYYRLDIFEDNLVILEVDATKENKNIVIPEFLEVLKEVTDDERYQNINIALKSEQIVHRLW